MKTSSNEHIWKGTLLVAAISAAGLVRARRQAVMAELYDIIAGCSAELAQSQLALHALKIQNLTASHTPDAPQLAELRHPLNALQLYTRLLQKPEGLSAETIQCIANRILISERRLSNLIKPEHNNDGQGKTLNAADFLVDATPIPQDSPTFSPHRQLSV